MIRLSPTDLEKATSTKIVINNGIKFIDNIEIDSRKIKKGDLFLALKGESFDGHDYIVEALSKGAVGYIGENVNIKADIVVPVKDSLVALQDIARYILEAVRPEVVAITGSTGKTTVKDLLVSILAENFSVVATKGNFNNEIGLPLTILQLKPETKILILEMGMRGLGHISQLCNIAKPDMAVITNIGQAHLEMLKTREKIIEAKAEIITATKDEGTIFLNIDNEATEELQKYTGTKKTITYGRNADVSCAIISVDEKARPLMSLKHNNDEIKIKLNLAGSHFVESACAAAAVALDLGAEVELIKEGLEKSKISPNRMDIIEVNNFIILNDTYNSSPDSAKAAIKTLIDIQAKRKIAILGSMLELGENSKTNHRQLGQEIAVNNIDLLFTVGRAGEEIASGALAAGMNKSNIFSFKNSLGLIKEIDSHLKSQDAILIKASRALKLEIVAEYLQKKR